MAGSVEISYDGSEQAPIHGHCPVTSTAAALAVAGLQKGRITRGILVRAPGPSDDTPNTCVVYVGGPQVTADNNAGTGGVPVPPGATISLPCRDPSLIFVVTKNGASTQDVSWLGV
jgi:hypothetical protein